MSNQLPPSFRVLLQKEVDLFMDRVANLYEVALMSNGSVKVGVSQPKTVATFTPAMTVKAPSAQDESLNELDKIYQEAMSDLSKNRANNPKLELDDSSFSQSQFKYMDTVPSVQINSQTQADAQAVLDELYDSASAAFSSRTLI